MGRTLTLRLLLILCAAAVPLAAARAQVPDRDPKVKVQLIAESGEVAPGGTTTVALEEVIRPHWHTYWTNPGDAGAPTEIRWSLPDGWRAGAIAWPYPRRLPVGDLMNYGYEGKVWLLVPVTAPKDAKPGDVAHLEAVVDWLVCKEICIPEQAQLSLDLNISAHPAPAYATISEQFDSARGLLPKPSPWKAVFRAAKNLDLLIVDEALARSNVHAEFFPLKPGIIRNAAPQRQGKTRNGLVLRLVPKSAHTASLDGVVVLTSRDGAVEAVEISARPGAVAGPEFDVDGELGLLTSLAFAFLGGLILNVMPCVLPVLAMKALAVAHKSGRERTKARMESFAYAIGAILSFAALGTAILVLRTGGDAIGWGFQLQMPIVVASFAFLMFAVGLDLSGLLQLSKSVNFGDSLTQRAGASGAFFTGVLAVAVAAPCTAPFMATALGFALTQAAMTALLVFLALGLGFAAPFVVLGFVPSLLKALPRPGPWMIRLRKILAIPMYATAAWLLWVLTRETGSTVLLPMLSGFVLFALSAWAYGINARRGRRQFLALAGFLAALSSLALVPTEPLPAKTVAADASGLASQPYSERRLKAFRSRGRPVFVNATAAWCITCLVNERTTLSNSQVRAAFARSGVVYMVADWTNRNAEITALLEAHQRSGVPLYLYYAPGAEDAVILPQILTPEAVLDVVK